MHHSRLVNSLLPLMLLGVSAAFSATDEPLGQHPESVMLPDEIRQSLEQNSRHLTPVSLTYTYELRSSLNKAESLQRLNLTHASKQDQIFAKHKYRFCHKDSKFRFTMWTPDDGFKSIAYDCSFDGEIACDLNNPAASGGPIAQFALNLNIPLVLVKQTVEQLSRKPPPLPIPAMLRERRRFYYTAAYATYNKHGLSWNTPAIESSVLGAMRDGAKLTSVETVQKDGHEYLRVELVRDNPLKRMALDIDIERLGRLRAFKDETTERQNELKALIEKQRQLPAMRKYVFYLDPAANYAVRTAEEWYEPDIILKRTECLELKRVPGRQVFLPWKCNVTLHEFPTVLAPAFKEDFLSEEWQILELGGDQIDDQQFVIDSTNVPGAIIQDGILARVERSPKPVIFTVPEQPEALQKVIADAVNDPRDVAIPLGFGSPLKKSISVQTVFLVGNAIVFVAIALYWALKRFSR